MQLFDSLLRRFRQSQPISSDLPNPGSIFAYSTSPFSEYAPQITGRWAALKVLGASNQTVVIAVLDRVWPELPTLAEARKASVLEQHRFDHTGKLAIFGVITDWWRDSELSNMTLLGSVRVSRSESKIVHSHMTFAVGTTHASKHAADYSAEGEWRWANDRDAFVAEQELVKAKAAQKQAAAEQRYRDRLSKLTWDQLLSETPFPDWEIPPSDFTQLARKLIHDACTSLKTLGPKPRKAWVRKILKETVERFNEADDAGGGVIETEEREDICEVLEELAFVAGQRSLTEEIDNWREW